MLINDNWWWDDKKLDINVRMEKYLKPLAQLKSDETKENYGGIM